MNNPINDLGKTILFIDGAMGTQLQVKGIGNTLPEIWNIENPSAILDVHNQYAAAGCDILTANTFGANRLKLSKTEYSPAQVIRAGVDLAKKAASTHIGASGKPAKVALDIGPTGRMLAPMGDLPFEEAVSVFAEMVQAGVAAGVDLILIETMIDTYEIKAAMLAAKENSDLPFMVTFSPDETGRILTGADIQTVAALVESLGACAVGINCGTGPNLLKAALAELRKHVQIPIIFSPNGGMPKVVDGETVFDLSPEEYASEMKESAMLGGSFLGGCCGTTPAHIECMIHAIREAGSSPAEAIAKPVKRVSSHRKTVIIGDDLDNSGLDIAVLIDNANASGIRQALLDNDIEYVCDEALAQLEDGADLLAVNVGLPGINPMEMLPRVVMAIQEITPTPLIIHTACAVAAEAALRVYNGRPVLNTIDVKDEDMLEIAKLAEKYGAELVSIALGDVKD